MKTMPFPRVADAKQRADHRLLQEGEVKERLDRLGDLLVGAFNLLGLFVIGATIASQTFLI